MAEDIDKVERARLARKAIIDHMDCDDCTEDYEDHGPACGTWIRSGTAVHVACR